MIHKWWLHSRTILLNIAIALVAAAVDNLHLLAPALSAKFFAWLAFGLALLNIALRSVTRQGVTLRRPEQDP